MRGVCGGSAAGFSLPSIPKLLCQEVREKKKRFIQCKGTKIYFNIHTCITTYLLLVLSSEVKNTLRENTILS